MVGSIYKITHKESGKIYIGLTTWTVDKRWKRHLCLARSKKKIMHLYRAIRRYGEDAFTIKTIETCNSKEDLIDREIYWISAYDTTNNKKGYNTTRGGEGGAMPPRIAKKIGLKKRGTKATPEWRAHISRSLKEYYQHHAHPMSEETKKKLSETKKRLGQRPPPSRLSGKDHPMFGKTHTEEVKKRLRISTSRSWNERLPKKAATRMRCKRRKRWTGAGNPNFVQIGKNELLRAIITTNTPEEAAKKLHISRVTVFAKSKKLLGNTPAKIKEKYHGNKQKAS